MQEIDLVAGGNYGSFKVRRSTIFLAGRNVHE
jgi:hypothetical protein